VTNRISVIIPSRNYARFIAEAIESVLCQTQAADEIVVVDDGSTDETESVVGRFRSAVRYIKQAGQGVSVARNKGVAESSGNLIAFLDADDTWEPEKLEMQVAEFADDPTVGLVHCGMREFDDSTGQTLGFHLDGCAGDVSESLLLWEEPSIVGPGGTIMITRSAFDMAGGYDPRISVGEDWDLCYRIARHYAVRFVPKPLVNYRNHGAAAHNNVSGMELGMSIFYEKAFAEGGDILNLRRKAYGNFYSVLAGSYFHAGQYGPFARNLLLSLWNRPGGIVRFAKFPFRRMRQD
jgi:glycosyltransferase involved in cell wall biosynthesis